MRSIALWLWYRGEGFRGYQSQPRGPTVQDALESALAQLSVPARPVAAGRTDLGVHARMQVVRLRLAPPFDAGSLVAALRPLLPSGLGIAVGRPALPGFHPQWSALRKEYRYRLYLDGQGDPSGPARSASEFAWSPSWRIEPERFRQLLRRCEGTRDFSAFHEKSSPIRPRLLERVELRSLGFHAGRELHEICWRGGGFGRYQVRYLTGSCAAAAAGVLSTSDFEAALDVAQPISGIKAPAHGLVLWEVSYPAQVDPFDKDARSEALRALPPGLPFAQDGV